MTRTHSELACYRKCPRLWSYRYEHRRQGLIPAQALSRGKRIHTFLAEWWSSTKGADLSIPGYAPTERAMLIGYDRLYERPHLTNVRVNVPFRVNIAAGLNVAGECDAVGIDSEGRTVIVEHKTTSSSIEPGGQYWRRVTHVDPQVSIYSLAFPGAIILYDVLHTPAFRAGDLYAKSLADMAENPGKYFQRATVVRLESETYRTIEDIVQQGLLMSTDTVRNPDACFYMGRECEFFAACWHGKDIESYPEWPGSENAEVVKERWGDG